MPDWHVHFNVRVRDNEPRLIRAVERSRAIAETIRNIPVAESVRERLHALNMARAVRGTTALEGTRISEDEALAVLEADPGQQVLPSDRSRDEREVRNAQTALECVRRTVHADPGRSLDEPLIREIHRLTTEGVPYPDNEPGRYRSHAVTVGDYRPPATGDDIRRLMTEFVRWFNQGRAASWDPIVRAAVAHFYVVTIHPCGDGNGRTSRAIESFILCRAGISAFGFDSLASFYYQNRDEYTRALTAPRFRSDGDLTDFVLFAAEGMAGELATVRDELMSVIRELQQPLDRPILQAAVRDEFMSMVRVLAFRDYARERLSEAPGLRDVRRTRMLEVIRRLTEQLLRGVPEHRLATDAVIDVVYGQLGKQTIRADLRLLEDQGLLVRRDGRLVPNVEIMSTFVPRSWRTFPS